MKRLFTLVLVAIVLTGCAHRDLKAPCANIAALSYGSIPCDQREPVNAALVPLTFAQ